MNKSVGIERVYSLGNYNMLRISDTISDIPDELMLDEKFIFDLRMLQLLQAEKTFVKYSQVSEKMSGISEEESLEGINAIIERKLESIVEKYNQTKGE